MKDKNNESNGSFAQIDKPDGDRRKAITGIVTAGAGAGAAILWHKPIINSVVLPAHAQTSTATRDFFATVADASVISVSAFLDTLIPAAYALASNIIAVSDLRFEAEAIDQGQGVYKIRIAADRKPLQNRVAPSTARSFVYGWEGTITGLNANAPLTETGCAQAETARITAIGATTLTVEMSYFSSTIKLDLDAGSAALPAFPLVCRV